MKDLAVVTTCMSRLEHLKASLELLMPQNCGIVVVDYSCPERCGDWVLQHHKDRVHVTCVPNQKYFNVAKARNAGALFAERAGYTWLLFLDCDILVSPDFIDHVRSKIGKGIFLCFKNARLPGLVGLQTVDFTTIEGYDEGCEGYGYEDTHLLLKLDVIGLKRVFLDEAKVKQIGHDDSVRTKNYLEKSVGLSLMRNAGYTMTKLKEFAEKMKRKGQDCG